MITKITNNRIKHKEIISHIANIIYYPKHLDTHNLFLWLSRLWMSQPWKPTTSVQMRSAEPLPKLKYFSREFRQVCEGLLVVN